MSTHIGSGYAPAFPPWLERQARRAVLLVWWTVTLQLPQRYALWRRARRMRRLAPITPALQPILVHEVDPRGIRVPRSADPTVSIIIPSYGKVEYTLRCLASIAAHPPAAAIEVIVVDDATPDGSTACLASVPGIRLIINPINLGYLRSCNTAARVAKGEFLLLLNNDTQVLPDWLDPLLLPFRITQRRRRGRLQAAVSRWQAAGGGLHRLGRWLGLEFRPAR